MPHPVGVDGGRTGLLGDADHPSVNVGGDAGDQALRALAPPVGRPGLPDQVEVSSDTAGGDDDRGAPDVEGVDDLPGGLDATRKVVTAFEDAPLDADDAPDAVGVPLDGEFVDTVTEGEGHPTCLLRLEQRLAEDTDDLGPGTPGEVKAGHGVSVAGGVTAATFGPADRR